LNKNKTTSKGLSMNDAIALRQQLNAAPGHVLTRLTAMGRIMIVAQDGGVTHERIGIVEKIRRNEGSFSFTGVAHDCTVDMSQVATAIADRSGKMKDKVLPRLELLNAGGELVFSVVGLDGIERFDEGLARFDGTAMAPKVKDNAAGARATLRDDDPAMQPLAAAHDADAEITIEMQKAGMMQRWRGVPPAINPAMGFVNIIAPDFHLHVRGGVVARWDRHDTDISGHARLSALDKDGKPTGLTLQGPRNAFGAE
jgi:putative heme degradation protein